METLTWGDIEQYALNGEDCEPDDLTALHADLKSALMLLWSKCVDDDYYQVVKILTIVEGTYELHMSEIGDSVHRITHMSAFVVGESCNLFQSTNVTCQEGVVGFPTHFETKGYGIYRKLYFDKTFDDDYPVTVTYQRLPETDIVIDEVYQVPDCPPELYGVLRDYAKARRFASLQDWSNASPQLQLANNTFDAIKPALEKKDDAKGAAVVTMTKDGGTTTAVWV